MGIFCSGMRSRPTRIYTNEQTRESGWLLGDYWDPDGNQPVHTSLNHQLCETLFLYRMEHITGDVSYGEAADQMLAGLTAVGTDWLQPDGNLWYSMEADGTMAGRNIPISPIRICMIFKKCWRSAATAAIRSCRS